MRKFSVASLPRGSTGFPKRPTIVGLMERFADVLEKFRVYNYAKNEFCRLIVRFERYDLLVPEDYSQAFSARVPSEICELARYRKSWQ